MLGKQDYKRVNVDLAKVAAFILALHVFYHQVFACFCMFLHVFYHLAKVAAFILALHVFYHQVRPVQQVFALPSLLPWLGQLGRFLFLLFKGIEGIAKNIIALVSLGIMILRPKAICTKFRSERAVLTIGTNRRMKNCDTLPLILSQTLHLNCEASIFWSV